MIEGEFGEHLMRMREWWGRVLFITFFVVAANQLLSI